MLYTIQNEFLTVQISDIGAELQSVRTADGERLWQGDPAYWGDRAPVLFPFCGRVWNRLCSYEGAPVDPGDVHGFFRHLPTVVEQRSETEAVFRQTESQETLQKYPFPYSIAICYRLEGNTLTVHAEVTNTGDRMLCYAYGGHPGFCVPFAGGGFEDYYLKFSDGRGLQEVCFDENCHFPIGGTKSYALENGDTLRLREAMFEIGSAFFAEMAPEVSLMTDLSQHRITMRYDGFRYLGIWKAAGASFLCIEPWTSMPATGETNTELTEKPDLVRLLPKQTQTHTYSIRFD